MSYVARTGPYVPNLGNFTTAAELSSTHPATLYNPGTTAYTTDQGLMVTDGNTWSDLAAAGSAALTGAIYALEQYGSAVGGFWDAALAFALTAIGAAGGGILQFGPKTYAFANQWPALFTTGGNIAVPILLQGSGPVFNGHWSTIAPYGGTILDLQNAAGTSGKIFLSGIGYFGARQITFYDSTSAGGALLYTTNATLDIDACAFVGVHTFANGNVPADQDAIICGGTTTTTSGTSPTAAFQGYGTKIRNCFFSGIRRGLYGRVYANGIWFVNNTISNNCGTKKAAVSADLTPFIAFDGTTAGTLDNCVGNVVRDNLFECNFLAYPILLNQAAQSIIGPNGFYDSVGNTVALVRLGIPLGTFTGTATASSPTITGVTAPLLAAGMFVSGTGIKSGTSVNSFVGTTVTLNQNAQVSGSFTFSFSASTSNNTIIAGTNGTSVPLIEDNSNGTTNFIDDQQGSGHYSQCRSLVAYPQGGPAFANAQFGSPEGGLPLNVTPDFPANAGIPNNTARAGQIINGAHMIQVTQAAADGSAISWFVAYNGDTTFGTAATSAQIKSNGMTWGAQGTGGQMTWDSGSGGSYGVLKHFGLKRSKYNGGGFVQNAQNNADGTEIWTTNNYVSKNYIELTTPITVAQLPAGVTGMKYIVSDATAPVFNATVVGGGAVVVPVFYNGANWVVG